MGIRELFKRKKKEVTPPIPPKTEKLVSDLPEISFKQPVKEKSFAEKPAEKIRPEIAVPFEKEEPKKVFVASDEYEKVLERIQNMNSRIAETEEITEELKNLKELVDKELKEWRSLLEKTSKKLVFVDEVIAKAQA